MRIFSLIWWGLIVYTSCKIGPIFALRPIEVPHSVGWTANVGPITCTYINDTSAVSTCKKIWQ
jgi:hypothetical protein